MTLYTELATGCTHVDSGMVGSNPELLHICAVCAFEYEDTEAVQLGFHELAPDWHCPCCGIGIEMFHHYSCLDFVTGMTGKTYPEQQFSTLDLKHLSA